MSLRPEIVPKVAFLGPIGSFSHQAFRAFCPGAEPLNCSSFGEVTARVIGSEAEYGLLPTNNLILGPIEETLQVLKSHELRMVRQERLPISLCLMAMPGMLFSDVRLAISHGAALRQCGNFLALHSLTGVTAPSTSEAAGLAALGGSGVGAIASSECAEHYSLNILQRDVQDERENFTIFTIFERTMA